ncbi:exonuclease domain-containing protein [Bacillus sp. RO1]|uniref:exonuclease domain-containing protein n=1 Tax=Bacillus sp. RO1 TaxID=2722703 RepID=UPI001456F5CE|nr:exonuclease domain-containing protein [Bacillus sp. RO1]NLP50248.1 DNA polymerase III subunit epsilon [Bacillus sp. RO1]
MDFVAFDFETANRNRHSICSVGMVFIENGVIVDSLYELINPEEEFDSFNTLIHGITESDVADALTFPVFYEKVKNKIENKLLIAHYMAFDGYALRDNLKRYGILSVPNDLLCTYQLSKRLIPNLPSYGIKPLCQHFQLDLNQHHHALDDAKACAELMVSLIEKYELHDLDAIYAKTYIKPGKVSNENYFSPGLSRNGEKLDLRTIEVSDEADPEHPFFGKNVVFTGKLSVFSRREAAELVGKKGGTPQNGINKQTDYIVLGDFEDVMIKGNKSSKLIKAEKMINEGKNIEIVSEQDFLKML